MKIRYGTRGSALALAQSDWVAAELKKIHRGIKFERVVIHTSGDRFAAPNTAVGTAVLGDVPEGAQGALMPDQSGSAVNVKAMFVKEIEEALIEGFVDFAVHSCKDLPAEMAPGLRIAAYPEREDARDVYIGGKNARRWSGLKAGHVVGTSSLRRQVQLQMIKPGIIIKALRGNVDTRLKRLEEGLVSGLMIAKAGLKRLGRESTPHEVLPADVIVPAPGQGALALQVREDRKEIGRIIASLDHPDTRMAVECERAVMKAIGGGCRTPLGAYAQKKENRLELHVFWSNANGQDALHRQGRCDAREDAIAGLVSQITENLRSHGKTG